MTTSPLYIRVFLSSPGDLAEERDIALKVIEQLHHRPMFRDRVMLRPIAWDKPGAGTPMLATMTPQEAINQGLPKPSQCDIVVVIFWKRMGTPLPVEYKKPDGSRYWSGTEWEYFDAFNAAKATGKPFLVVYRRTEKATFDSEAPNYQQLLEQQNRVKVFFDNFSNPDGSIRQGYNHYEKPDNFRQQFETDLEQLVLWLLEKPEAPPKHTVAATPTNYKSDIVVSQPAQDKNHPTKRPPTVIRGHREIFRTKTELREKVSGTLNYLRNNHDKYAFIGAIFVKFDTTYNNLYASLESDSSDETLPLEITLPGGWQKDSDSHGNGFIKTWKDAPSFFDAAKEIVEINNGIFRKEIYEIEIAIFDVQDD